jgi:transcriptional antiterminator RfaH
LSWIVVYTKPLQELRAKENLENLGLDVYLPLRPTEKIAKGSFVVGSEPLFYRYIFVRNNGVVLQKIMHMLRNARGVSHVLKFGGKFAELTQEAVRGMSDVEKRLLSRPMKVYRKGDNVSFSYGAFTDIEAVFRERDGANRVILLFDLLNKSTKMSVPLRAVKKVR